MAAWVLTGVAAVLLVVAVGLVLNNVMFAQAIGWTAIVMSAVAGVAHVRSYFISQNRMIRVLLAGHRVSEQAAELRPVR